MLCQILYTSMYFHNHHLHLETIQIHQSLLI
nr:MAG TPA: hypothetical protein [Caudoviricetes sp.]